MAKNDILTNQEITHFIERLRATVSAAHESQSLITALTHLVNRDGAVLPARVVSAGRRGATSAAAATGTGTGTGAGAGAGAGAATASEGARGGRRGRGSRVADSQILDMLRGAANGLSMRNLEGELKQHPETIRLKLRKLRAAGLVRTTGPRNQLRYHATGGSETVPTVKFRGIRAPHPKLRPSPYLKFGLVVLKRIRVTPPLPGTCASAPACGKCAAGASVSFFRLVRAPNPLVIHFSHGL